MCQEGIFSLQAAVVVVASLFGHEVIVQQSCLSEEGGFHLQGVVAVLGDGARR